jgi:uncharacterized protein (DUF302 family)
MAAPLRTLAPRTFEHYKVTCAPRREAPGKEVTMPAPTAPTDPTDETSDESFPASDAPAWTGMHAGPPDDPPTTTRIPATIANLRVVRCAARMAEAVARVEGALAGAGMKIFARIDQAAEARAVGLAMRPTVIILFGNPKGGTPLMVARPTVAIDLPLKALLWEDDRGAAWLAYNLPELLVERHGLDAALAANIAPAGPLLENAVR